MGHGDITITTVPAPAAQPVDEEPVPEAKRSVWDTHFGLFLTIIILVALCIIVTIICCICLRCRARDDSEKVSTVLAVTGGKCGRLRHPSWLSVAHYTVSQKISHLYTLYNYVKS